MHFKNIPFTCFICKVFGHMAQECTFGQEIGRNAVRKEAENVEEKKNVEESDGNGDMRRERDVAENTVGGIYPRERTSTYLRAWPSFTIRLC